MSLFRRAVDKSPITFNCAGISDDEREHIRKIVEENGGKMGESELHIMFMDESAYSEDQHPISLRVYSINFIKACVESKQIVDIERYRLSKKKLGEDAIVYAFLYGVDCQLCHAMGL